MPDATKTYRLTTAEAPEWAAAVTSDARDAEIARLQAENRDLDTANGHLAVMVQEDGAEIERLKRELAERGEPIAGLKAELGGHRLARETMQRQRDEHDKRFLALAKQFADVKAECCRLTCRNGDLEAENKRLMVAGGEVSALRYLASHSLDTAIYKLELAMAGTPSAYPPSVPTAARNPVEGPWLVEETTLYTLNERGTNRIYATFHGKGTEAYEERCELARRCRDALNSPALAKAKEAL